MLDDYYCYLIYTFQKELKITLTGDYPVARFNVLKDEMIKDAERNKENQEDANR